MTKGDIIYWKKGQQGEPKKTYYVSKSNNPDWYTVSDNKDDIENTYLINKRWITKSNINETKMTKEDLKSQMLAGIITESEYRMGCEKLLITESKKTSKKSLKENLAYPSVIGDFVKTPKTDYEMAFEHFLGGKVNENEETVSEETVNEELSEEDEDTIFNNLWDTETAGQLMQELVDLYRENNSISVKDFLMRYLHRKID